MTLSHSSHTAGDLYSADNVLFQHCKHQLLAHCQVEWTHRSRDLSAQQPSPPTPIMCRCCNIGLPFGGRNRSWGTAELVVNVEKADQGVKWVAGKAAKRVGTCTWPPPARRPVARAAASSARWLVLRCSVHHLHSFRPCLSRHLAVSRLRSPLTGFLSWPAQDAPRQVRRLPGLGSI